MKVKKYIVDSMPDALQKIRSELGKDAVIINTKEIRVGGFLGMFGKKKVEVVAATDTNPEASAASKPLSPTGAGGTSSSGAAEAWRRAAAAATRAGENARETAGPSSAPSPRMSSPLGSAYAPSGGPAANSTRVSEAAFPAAPSASAPPASAKDEALLSEMKKMKEMVEKLANAQLGSNVAVVSGLPEPFDAIKRRLIEQDVREEVASHVVEQALAEVGDAAGIGTEAARSAVKRQIVDILTRRPIEGIRQDARLVHFMGPTGVGKTTTIAKLAAEQALKHRRTIGLITSDTYRIAAIEQLRTYASILDVPLEVVFSPHDLQKALAKMEDRDMILMDTAGRNFRNELAVSELFALLRTEEKKDAFLVLSLSMKYTDMKAVTDNFYRFGLEKVLFTKADETSTLGAVVNLLYEYPMALSYVTDGQNVPDDIDIADANHIADELVGDTHDE